MKLLLLLTPLFLLAYLTTPKLIENLCYKDKVMQEIVCFSKEGEEVIKYDVNSSKREVKDRKAYMEENNIVIPKKDKK